MLEALGFGRHFVIDVYQAHSPHLQDSDFLRTTLEELAHTYLKPAAMMQDMSEQGDGVTLGLIMPESQMVLHAFPDRHAFHMRIFSRRDFDMQSLWQQLKSQLKAGRYDTMMTNRCTLLQPEAFKDQLGYERDYAQLRLEQALPIVDKDPS